MKNEKENALLAPDRGIHNIHIAMKASQTIVLWKVLGGHVRKVLLCLISTDAAGV